MLKMGERPKVASRPRTNTDGVGIPKMEPVKKMKGAVMRSSGPGKSPVAVGNAKPMSGPKTTKNATGRGTQGITTQGDRQGGMTAGRSRTNKGRNNVGSGRAQSY